MTNRPAVDIRLRDVLLVDYKTNRVVPDTAGSLSRRDSFRPQIGCLCRSTARQGVSRPPYSHMRSYVDAYSAALMELARCTDTNAPIAVCAILRTGPHGAYIVPILTTPCRSANNGNSHHRRNIRTQKLGNSEIPSWMDFRGLNWCGPVSKSDALEELSAERMASKDRQSQR